MKLINDCSGTRQSVYFAVYKKGSVKGIPYWDKTIAWGDSDEPGLSDDKEWDVYTTPQKICPIAEVKTTMDKTEDLTTYDNQHHLTDSVIFLAAT